MNPGTKIKDTMIIHQSRHHTHQYISATVPLGTRGVFIRCPTAPGDGCGPGCPWNCLRAPPPFLASGSRTLHDFFSGSQLCFRSPFFTPLRNLFFFDFWTPKPPKVTSKWTPNSQKTGADGLPEKHAQNYTDFFHFFTFFEKVDVPKTL